MHTLTAVQTNPAGTASASSLPLTITIDTITPAAASAPALSAGSDSGVVGDGLTNVNAPTITGTGITGDLVTLYDGATAIGTATVIAGTWTITSPALADGVHHLHDIQTSPAGNASAASGTLALTIDTAVPAASSAPALAAGSDSGVVGDHLTDDTTPTLTGTGIDGDIVTLYDGATAIGTAIVVGGIWTITAPTLADGVHDLATTQTSPAGNVSAASGTLALTIDTTVPVAPSTPALNGGSDSGIVDDGITNVTTPVMTGTGVTGDLVTLYDGTTAIGTATVVVGAWSITAPVLANGVHPLTTVQTSPAGKASVASGTLALTIDTIAPAATSTPTLSAGSDSGVLGDGLTNVTDPVITGIGVTGDTVTLYDGSTALGTATVVDGAWAPATGVLPAGLHDLTTTQTSPAGNLSAASGTLALIIDTTALAPASTPFLSIGSDSGVVGDHLTDVTTPVITGTGINGDTVTLYDGAAAIGTATVIGGTWSITSPALLDGVHTLTTTQTSPAGNVSAASAALALTIDTAVPAAASAAVLASASDSGTPGDGITNVTTPVLTGTGIAGDIVYLHDGTAIVGSATVLTDGTWSITASLLADGIHSLTTTQASPAGDMSAASAALWPPTTASPSRRCRTG